MTGPGGGEAGARTGLALRDPLPWHDVVQVVESAEQTGFETLFLPEIASREAFATLAALAGVTSRLRLASGVVPVPSRTLQAVAMAASTVHELSGGRMVLGLGAGSPGPGALARLRESVRILRETFAGNAVQLGGGESFRLGLDPGPEPPAIWVAALGPRAMRLAGEVADGILLNWCPPERVAFARERIREGAKSAGRDPATVDVGVYLRACVGQDPEVALAALRAAAGEYASYAAYRRQFEAVGLGAEAAAAAEAHAAGLPHQVPESLVRAVCLLGEADTARRRLAAYRDAGTALPVVYPVACLEPVSSIMGTLFALAPTPLVES